MLAVSFHLDDCLLIGSVHCLCAERREQRSLKALTMNLDRPALVTAIHKRCITK